jgi:hypothetical protein
MRITLTALLSFIFSNILVGQITIEKPNAAEQSQPELKILSIVFHRDSTVVNLSIENKLAAGGWYCADKKIYIEDPKSRYRYFLIKTRGIPTCPAVHNFTRAGEILNFTLTFTPIKSIPKLVNLIEDCNQSCFSFKGIILDKNLNDDINTYTSGVEHYAANRTKEAIECFMKVVEEIPEFPTHVYGYSYFNLIRIFHDKGDEATKQFWLEQMERSTLPDKKYFIEALQKEGVIKK